MDAVTYPEEKVTDFISEQTIPLRVSSTDAMADEFNVQWTPTLVVLDAQGKEHSRTIGFLGPAEIAPVLLLGEARAYFNREENEQALTVLGKLLAEFPASDQIPEAIFFQGVALYKHTHEPKHLRVAYDRLTNEHPGHEWTKRAYPYRLIGE